MHSYLHKKQILCYKNGKYLFQGRRNTKDKLWDWTQYKNSLPKNSINYIITRDKTKLELARYYHAALFSPAISTSTKAIKIGNLITWPGIDNLNFKDLIGTSLATELGHLDQERKNLRSTQTQMEISNRKNLQTNETYLQCINVEEHNNLPQIRKNYSDQTGRFPYQSSRGNQ